MADDRNKQNPLMPEGLTASPLSLPRDLNAEVGAFLSAASKSTAKFDLRDGFYTPEDNETAASRTIDTDDIQDHHKTSNFPHVRHQYGPNTGHGHKKRHHHHHHHRKHDKKPQASHPDTIEEVNSSPRITDPSVDLSADPQATPANPQVTPADPQLTPVSVIVQVEDDSDNASDGTGVGFYVGDSPSRSRSGSRPLSIPGTEADMIGVPTTGDEPPRLSARGAASIVPSKSTQRVSFKIRADEEDGTPTSSTRKDSSSSDGHLKPRRHQDRIPSELDMALRRHLGSEIQLEAMGRDISEEIREEEGMLADADIDEMSSHRFFDVKGLRKHKVTRQSGLASVVHQGKSDKTKKAPTPKKYQDHSPHEMFVELDELHIGEDKEWVWQERARWIKFEEDVEEGAERWGKPHVASLSFHSLLELRKCLEQGTVLLDLDCDDLSSIANIVVDKFVAEDQLNPEHKGAVLKAILLKHKHVGDKNYMGRSRSHLNVHLLGDHSSSKTKKSFLADMTPMHSQSSPEIIQLKPTPNDGEKKDLNNSSPVVVTVDEPEKSPKAGKKIESPGSRRSSAPNSPSLRRIGTEKQDLQILKRIPTGSEATTVLVGSVDFLEKPVMAFVRLSEGKDLGNMTEVPLPVRFIFFLLGPANGKLDYYEIGRSISTLMADTLFHNIAYYTDDRQDLLDAINQFLDESIVLPPERLDKNMLLPIMDMARRKSEQKRSKDMPKELETPVDKSGDPLRRTKRLFGGLVNDAKRRYPMYLSDIKDGLNLQCLAAAFFIYFAALSPTITFGGLLGETTQSLIGVSEMPVATCVCGILAALLSAQPLIICGFTGPILVFEEGLFQVCESTGLEYLPFRFWVGIWVTIIGIVVVMLEGSFMVRYITRFTEEIFASLIALIFIYEVFRKLYVIYHGNPLLEYYPDCLNSTTDDLLNDTSANGSAVLDSLLTTTKPLLNLTLTLDNSTNTNSTELEQEEWTKGYPNTFLFCVILTMGTFLIAMNLKKFRNGKFLGRSLRRAIGDFGIPIAIIIMVGVSVIFSQVYTEKLNVPASGFSPTSPDKRGWFINPTGMERPLPVWAYFIAVLPGLLVAILLFMQTLITSVIINKKDRNLKKGSGYHLDLLLIGCFASISGVLGLPMVCVATVRSVTHVSALSVFSKTHAPGEKPKLVNVHEQRVTGLTVHIMIGLSVLLGPVLKYVPLAVLFGVFLYMGVASMSGIQLFERVALLFMPVKHHPDISFVRRVRTVKMHLYTFIQLLCLGLLWAIKSTAAALAFPFILILLIPVRLKLMGYIFTPKELLHLDAAEEGAIDDEEDEPDFYQQAHLPG